MADVVHSILEYWKTRVKTQVYGLFTFWYIVLHSQLFFTLLFIDQQQIYTQKHMLKNEYIWTVLIRRNDWHYWLTQALLISLAAFLTYVMIWWLPRLILKPSYEKEKENEYDRRLIKIRFEDQYEKGKKALASTQAITLKAEKEVIDLKDKVNESWLHDFKEFKESALFNQFAHIKEALYEHNKYVSYEDESGSGNSIPTNILAYADGNELITIDSNKIELTDKGRFFMKQYLATQYKPTLYK